MKNCKPPYTEFVAAVKKAKTVLAEVAGSHGYTIPVAKKDVLEMIKHYPEGFRISFDETFWAKGSVVGFEIREIGRYEQEDDEE